MADATGYAYSDAWNHIVIWNLSALRSRSVDVKSVPFKAFIKSFKDNFNPGWQEIQYPNQSVPIAHQSMPKRSIQLEWTVPSYDAAEAIGNLQKCSWLAQSMYPTLRQSQYGRGSVPKSTFMAIKYANFIQANNGGPLPGYISSFSYTPNFVEGIHILKQSEVSNQSGLQRFFSIPQKRYLFPNLVDIVMEFKPIQTRDSFGLVQNRGQDIGWSNSSWPYGVKIDSKLKPGQSVASINAETDEAIANLMRKTGEKKVTGSS